MDELIAVPVEFLTPPIFFRSNKKSKCSDDSHSSTKQGGESVSYVPLIDQSHKAILYLFKKNACSNHKHLNYSRQEPKNNNNNKTTTTTTKLHLWPWNNVKVIKHGMNW